MHGVPLQIDTTYIEFSIFHYSSCSGSIAPTVTSLAYENFFRHNISTGRLPMTA